MTIENNKDQVQLTSNDGQRMTIPWNEFWNICKEGDRFDVLIEIEEYLEQCDYIGGVNCSEILENKQFLDVVTNKVIASRIEQETSEDIFEEIYNLICGGKYQ